MIIKTQNDMRERWHKYIIEQKKGRISATF